MFHYFGYGSNMNQVSLRAKGVAPRSSVRATLRGWRLCFDVEHWFRHEGGVGNIRPSADPSDAVMGVVHLCEDDDLAKLDAVEAYGVGYDRIEVEVQTANGPRLATAYIGLEKHTDPSCLPTRRYLNILVEGARAAGIDADYIARLEQHPVHAPKTYPDFAHPPRSVPEFTRDSLAEHPKYTALAGAVFDMSGARWQHHYLWDLFGGRDMTLFHLKRLDTADGSETIDDLLTGRLTPVQREYLNAYLNEYDVEYRYVGRYRYPFPDHKEPPMSQHNPVMPHGNFQEVFPGVYFVQGTYTGEFFGSMWTFSRNMTVIKEGDALTLINAVRLDDAGLAALDALGTVTHVVKIGSMHGHDDAFYVDRYKAAFWAMPGMPHAEGLTADRDLAVGGEMPFSGCTMFAFETTKLPECILVLDREGGIAIACDALQNWVAQDDFIDDETAEKMAGMGFFTPATLGPAWLHVNEPSPSDFQRLKNLPFAHALCGHGQPLMDSAREDYAATFARIFSV